MARQPPIPILTLAAFRYRALPPSRHYLTGFLAPETERAPEEIAEDDPLPVGDDLPEEETQGSTVEEPKGRNLWPASVGLSVLLPAATKSVAVSVRFAEYIVENVRQSEKKRPKPFWRRKPKQTINVDVPLDPKQLEPVVTRRVLSSRRTTTQHRLAPSTHRKQLAFLWFSRASCRRPRQESNL